MPPVLLLVGALPALLLCLYALGHYGVLGVFLATRTDRRAFGAPTDAVTVAVPARNEGAGAVRVIESLLAQDHVGPVAIVLLVRDPTDTALPFLEAAFPQLHTASASPEFEVGNRRVSVAWTGVDPKHAKVNWLAERASTPYLAILDADHLAHPEWLRTSVALLQEGGSRLVQARREPLSARGLFGLWDSLHQHVGCEVANVAYQRLGLTVFFTGTTAVMDAALLRDFPLRDCLTEDTDLSYRLIVAGHQVAYNPHSGSKEEVSPDLYSFLARRRRWAHGHTEAFGRALPGLLTAPLGVRRRAQLLFHGAHYLVALAVFAIHAVVGVHLARELPVAALLAASSGAATLAFLLARSQPGRGRLPSFAVFGVIVTWLAPALILAIHVVLAVLRGDPAPLAVPIPLGVSLAGLLGFLAPLLVLLAGLARFGQLGPASALVVVGTYPLALYLDVAGVLIGLGDLALGRRTWLAIARGPTAPTPTTPWTPGERWYPVLSVAAARRALFADTSLLMKPSRWIPAVLVVAAVGLGAFAALPVRRIALAPRACEVLPHDGDPWIVPAAKLEGYCGPLTAPGRDGMRTGTFQPERTDALATVDPAYWDRLDTTFFCNDAVFAPENVVAADGATEFVLKPEERGGKAYTAGSIATKEGAEFQFGRFEAELRPPKVSGVLTAMFLYRFDPWQEIDLEFMDRDTTKVMLNVFYNPGEPGDLYNYGYRGTPVVIELGFDAALAYHRYAIEWDPDEIRWFVDGELIHARAAGRPTPIPHLPMRLHLNTWPICSEELAGPLDVAALPAHTGVRNVQIASWRPPYGGLLAAPPKDWRSEATWLQP